MRLDTVYTVHTPEGITLELSPAGPVPRTLAWIVDLLIRSAISILVLLVLALSGGNLGLGIALIFIFLLEWFYPVWFELRHHGQTPGKKILQLHVTHVDASPVSPAASVIRNLLRVVDFLPFLYGSALISLLVTRRFQRLGDLAANTVVLHKPMPTIQPPPLTHQPQKPAHNLSLPEQQAIILFAQRQHTLTNERQHELAKLAGRLSHDQATATDNIHRIASWLAGSRR